MDLDPRKLSIGELCQVLNSHPQIGEVTTEAQLRKHQKRAGMRIGDGKTINLPRYIAWLVHTRHAAGAHGRQDTIAGLKAEIKSLRTEAAIARLEAEIEIAQLRAEISRLREEVAAAEQLLFAEAH